MGHDGETQARGVAEIGRSLMKTVADFAKIRPDENQTAHAMMAAAALVTEPTNAPANDTTLNSPNVAMAGTLVTPDDLHIAGKIDGNVRATSVTVHPSGVVRGDIIAETVIVHGTVEGRIYGVTVQLAANAHVTGDIFHGALGIDTNATFEGASRRVADVMAEAPAFADAA